VKFPHGSWQESKEVIIVIRKIELPSHILLPVGDWNLHLQLQNAGAQFQLYDTYAHAIMSNPCEWYTYLMFTNHTSKYTLS
jgi:hypothetical protein